MLRMLLETSLDRHRRDWASGEATESKWMAQCVPGLYVTQLIHSTNTEDLR